MSVELSAIVSAVPESIATASLMVATSGAGFTEITREVAGFLAAAKATQGILFIFMRHTSASLVIQENADPDVRTDLKAALARIAPDDAGWVHETEGADDMPAHVKTMVTGVSLHVPVRARARPRHLAGDLCRRAPHPATPARDCAAVPRQPKIGVDHAVGQRGQTRAGPPLHDNSRRRVLLTLRLRRAD